MNVENEATLVAAAAAGDPGAFERLIRAHDETMRRLAHRMLGSTTAMDDALQDAYLKAWRSLGRFDGRSSFSTWLYRITANVCLEHLRTRNRQSEVAMDETRVPPSGRPGPEREVAERDRLQWALGAMPPEYRAAVLLVDGEGLSYDEAAAVLDIAPGTVASRLNRARRALRVVLYLEETEDTDENREPRP
jgi:RNA polymerase sigma-70 factor (ECF subfamily)